MSFRRTAIWATLLASIGAASCLATMGARERLVAKRAAFDLGCESTLLTVKQIGENAYSVLGCNQKASYVVECADRDGGECRAVLVSVSN